MKDNNFIDILGYKIFKNSLNDAINYIDKKSKIHIISGNPEDEIVKDLEKILNK